MSPFQCVPQITARLKEMLCGNGVTCRPALPGVWLRFSDDFGNRRHLASGSFVEDYDPQLSARGVFAKDISDAQGEAASGRQVEELVGAMGVGAWAQDAGDAELRLGKLLA
jgi:hypothetical protein